MCLLIIGHLANAMMRHYALLQKHTLIMRTTLSISCSLNAEINSVKKSCLISSFWTIMSTIKTADLKSICAEYAIEEILKKKIKLNTQIVALATKFSVVFVKD